MDEPLSPQPKNKPNDFRLSLGFALQPVPLIALDNEMREILSKGLNKQTVKTTVHGVVRNFRGFGELAGFDYGEIQDASQSENPTESILNSWALKPGSSVGRLVDHLTRMERFDLLDDLHPVLTKNSSIHFMPYISKLEVTSDEIEQETARARNFGLNYFSRVDWGAYCPRQKSVLAVNPVKLVFIHHSVWYDADPIYALKVMQSRKIIHYAHNDLPYSFIISNDGRIFEGRGWDLGGSHTLKYNYVALSFAMLGNYQEHKVTSEMLESLKKLFEYGVLIGKIHPDYGIYAHRDASETESPGQYTVEAISTWPHYHAFGDLPPAESFFPPSPNT